MKCPNCDKEPFKLFSLKSSGIGIWKVLRGYTKCIHCDTILKRKYGWPYWITLLLTLVIYTAIYILLWHQPIDMSTLPGWFFILILVTMIVLMVAVAFTAVFSMRFETVSEKEDESQPADI